VAGDDVEVATQVLAADAKRLHVFHTMIRTRDGAPLATAEQMLLHVDTRAARVVPAARSMLERVTALAAAHAALPQPERAGHAIAMPSGGLG
jgi:carnitine 3-dehydrogenase